MDNSAAVDIFMQSSLEQITNLIINDEDIEEIRRKMGLPREVLDLERDTLERTVRRLEDKANAFDVKIREIRPALNTEDNI